MKNPKWKEWWQNVQKFTKEQIQKNMELVRSNEHSYQLEIQAYQPPNFVYVEIKSSSITLATPIVVQLVVAIKLVNPLRSGTYIYMFKLL